MKITQFRLTLQTFRLLEELYHGSLLFKDISHGLSRTALSQLLRRAQLAGLIERRFVGGNEHGKYVYLITEFGIILLEHVTKYIPETYKWKEEKK